MAAAQRRAGSSLTAKTYIQIDRWRQNLEGRDRPTKVTPRDVAHLDAKKLLEFLAPKQVPVLGAVENMSGVECPQCHHEFSLFTPAAQSRAIWADGVARLAVFPSEEAAVATGRGEPTSTAISEAFRLLANEVLANMPPKPRGC